MASLNEIPDRLNQESVRSLFQRMYSATETEILHQIKRYNSLATRYPGIFAATDDIRFFSTPGRIELAGNHTDHNNGCVLASAVNIDILSAAATTSDNIVTLYSDGVADPFIIDLARLKIDENEKGTTNALVRGIAAKFHSEGLKIGGIKAVLTSDVGIGSGLSSSAAFEVLIATIFNRFYNKGVLARLQLAQFGQFAENNFFGKPCGLMDQIACSLGGIVAIDFKKPQSPEVKRIRTDLLSGKTSILVADTGGTHTDLTDDYAHVGNEMRMVAAYFQKQSCRELSWPEFRRKIPELRKKTGDRAVLRAMHFFQENERVRQQMIALEKDDLTSFLNLMAESGTSSWKQVQNIFAAKCPENQGVALGLSMTEQFLQNIPQSACRVHGGGFAGTIIVFLPNEKVPDYQALMEPVFGPGCVQKLAVRNNGTLEVKL
ncbi:MAG: galactokinase [Calditrichaeota bacterium]|nr:MAG: galactokinase [Calditrichota bacterium]